MTYENPSGVVLDLLLPGAYRACSRLICCYYFSLDFFTGRIVQNVKTLHLCMIQDWGSDNSWGTPLPPKAWSRHPQPEHLNCTPESVNRCFKFLFTVRNRIPQLRLY